MTAGETVSSYEAGRGERKVIRFPVGSLGVAATYPYVNAYAALGLQQDSRGYDTLDLSNGSGLPPSFGSID